MSLFGKRYIYIYNTVKSREFLTAGGCGREAAEKINDHPWADGWRVATEGNVGVIRKDFRRARERFVQLIGKVPVGQTVRFEALRGDEVIDRVRARPILVSPPVKDTRGPIGLDRVEGYIESEFPNARWAGDCVCKPNSDHRDCAAVDYFDSETNMVKMRDEIKANPLYFNMKYIILFDRIWFPDGSSRPHTGTFHSHIHISVFGGTPGAAC